MPVFSLFFSSLLSQSKDSQDIESMQKNIGDLQQRLNEVTSPTAKNGPSSSVPTVSLKLRDSGSESVPRVREVNQGSGPVSVKESVSGAESD